MKKEVKKHGDLRIPGIVAVLSDEKDTDGLLMMGNMLRRTRKLSDTQPTKEK